MHLPLLTTGMALLVHSVFEWLGIATGVQLYRRSIKGATPGLRSWDRLVVAMGAIAGGALGSKIAFFLYDPNALRTLAHDLSAITGGQSIVGGLLGGLVGVEVAKRLVNVRTSTGDAFVRPLLVGIVIGRFGCLLAGLNDVTYGNPTTLPWGVDFGDGVSRHPTQIYDQLFALALLWLLGRLRPMLQSVPGLEFKFMLMAYLLWRLGIDAIKPMACVYPGGLSGIQVLCLVGLIAYLPFVVRATRSLPSAALLTRSRA